MNQWKLGRDGFVMQYMIAGPKAEDFSSQTTARDQMTLEGLLREEIVSGKAENWEEEPVLGAPSEIGEKWQLYVPYENTFVDKCYFYSTLKKVTMEVAACLVAEAEETVRVKVWTYMSAAVYVNGKLAGQVPKPVYKPINGVEMELPLHAGENLVLCVCENLGVRDTRNILGLQLLEKRDCIHVVLPDVSMQEQVYADTAMLWAVRPENGKIVLPDTADARVSVRCISHNPDFFEVYKPQPVFEAEGKREIPVPEGVATVAVQVKSEAYTLEREIEFEERFRPKYSKDPAAVGEVKTREIMERVGAVKSLNRGEFGFAIMNLLARKYLGRELPEDRSLLFSDLALVEERVDCADFLICGLIRYKKVYGVDAEVEARLKEVLLGFRYWMNMEGMDAMCFWSENHSMMFYSSAMFAGQMYPDEYFSCAKMTGRELEAFGKGKLLEWLDELEKYGYEEFLSAVYMCVTLAALLNLVDFAEPEISARAEKLCDLLMEELAKHSFRGCLIAPMGRVYRGILYPFSCAIASVMNMIDGTAPYDFGEGWLGFLAGTRYRIPEAVRAYVNQNLETEYSTGNALVRLKKTEDYCLSSVQSPRQDGWMRWENLREDMDADTDRHVFTESLNESFHGTSLFAPGTYGYQQHMWMAALSGEAVLFVNHPGAAAEKTGMRPGYWYGNGVMPALRQQGSLLEAIYVLPDAHPIHFTHVYCPKSRFDEVKQEAHWMFLRKDHGYMALWCSGEYVAHNDMIFDCEQRVYGSEHAYVGLMGCEAEHGSFESFIRTAKELKPVYDADTKTLRTEKSRFHYEPGADRTQFVK